VKMPTKLAMISSSMEGVMATVERVLHQFDTLHARWVWNIL
jgi:hypothetical protein